MIFLSFSAKETENFARKILDKIIKKRIIFLKGDLGSGKTTFVKGVANCFLIKENIKSPTFVIMRKYQSKIKNQNKSQSDGLQQNHRKTKIKNLYHFDCYRIKSSKEILELGWEKIINNPENIVLIEWGEKIKDILPKNTLHIKFKFVDENTRKITI